MNNENQIKIDLPNSLCSICTCIEPEILERTMYYDNKNVHEIILTCENKKLCMVLKDLFSSEDKK